MTMTWLKSSDRFVITVLALAIAQLSFGQAPDLDALIQEYGNSQMYERNKQVVFDYSIKKGELVITRSYTEERVYLSQQASMYAERSVSFDFWTEIPEIDAYSLIPKGIKGGFTKNKVSDFTTKDEFTDGIFHSDERSMNFRFEGLQKGAETYFHYDSRINNVHQSSITFLVSMLPCKNLELIIRCDTAISLGINTYHLEGANIRYSETEDKGRKEYRWTATDLKETNSKDYQPDVTYFLPHVINYVKSYRSNGELVPVFRNVNDLFSYYDGLLNDMPEEDLSTLQSIVDTLCAGKNTEEEKVKAMFEWVQDNIKYVAVEYGIGGFVPRTASYVCDKRFGDCKDMAFLFSTMAKMGGVNVQLAWIGTRDRPYSYEELPCTMVDNHMINAWKHNGTWVFLDPTGKMQNYLSPTSFIQGKEAMIKTDTGFEVARVPEVPETANVVTERIRLKVEDDNVIGEATTSLTGYYRGSFLRQHDPLNEKDKQDFYKRYFEKGNDKFSFSDLEIAQEKQRSRPLEVSYHFDVQDYLVRTGDELILNLNLTKPYLKQRHEDDRTVPRHFEFKGVIETIVELEVPEGYEVVSVPKDSKYETDSFLAEAYYERIDDQIRYTQRISILDLEVEGEELNEWNEMLNVLSKAYKSAVVLKNKTSGNDQK